jgi:hypothetical protein
MARCHSAVQAGYLEIYRNSKGKLEWKSRAERITALLADEVRELAGIPQVVVVVPVKEKHPVTTPPATASPPATAPEIVEVKREAKGVNKTLVGLGYKVADARGRTARALALLADLGRAPTGDEIFNTAVYGPADGVRSASDFRKSGERN